MTIYIDISEYIKKRANTGIQRVTKEYLYKAIISNINIKVLNYNVQLQTFELIPNEEVLEFFEDVQNYVFKNLKSENIFLSTERNKIFFEMDSVWNASLKRSYLYKELKLNGFKIFNFIYDFVPVLFPDYSHENTVRNFVTFIASVYEYSDMIFFDSHSAEGDFFSLKEKLGIKKSYSTKVVRLGSDFIRHLNCESYQQYDNILNSKYILFVGTIEPRKMQPKVLEAFDILSEKYKDLNLVFIGKNGWKVDDFIQNLTSHHYYNKKVFWLSGIDDEILNLFYSKAYIVTYLSSYEGYGLPIAESLSFGNITITSKNSSMYEVGQNYADYVLYNSTKEIVDIISYYYDNPISYNIKKDYIKSSYKSISWNEMFDSIQVVFDNYENSLSLMQTHSKKLQFVFISIDYHNIQKTIHKFDKLATFIKSYIVVTKSSLLEEFKFLSSKYEILIINEDDILREYKTNFTSKDHQSKNWILRASLLNLDILDEEFIMLDDDNQPLANINLTNFITAEGKYNCYYFYNLLYWNHFGTEYDIGQHKTKKILYDNNYELLSYSSHCPQIINKSIFKEVVEIFFDIGLKYPIDEWSIYFNYANAKYPFLFNKLVFQTLNWPAYPSNWDFYYTPKDFIFENYYKDYYSDGNFMYIHTSEQKVDIKKSQQSSYLENKELFNSHIKQIVEQHQLYTYISFSLNNTKIVLSTMPSNMYLMPHSIYRITLTCKTINQSQDLSICLVYNDCVVSSVKIPFQGEDYSEVIVELPINTHNMDIDFSKLTLVVSDDKQNSEESYPININIYQQSNKSELKDQQVKKGLFMKERIKHIPIVGFVFKWIYNIIRINNLKHHINVIQNHNDSQNIVINNHTQTIQEQSHKIQILTQQIVNLEELLKEISEDNRRLVIMQNEIIQQKINQLKFDLQIDQNIKNR